jgi:hypothetical protein
MAKKRKMKRGKKAAVPGVPVPRPPFVINPFGPMKQKIIKRRKIVPSTFTLNDGTRLIVTPILSNVQRALDQFNDRGEPLYFLTLGQMIKTIAPKRLHKKIRTRKK